MNSIQIKSIQTGTRKLAARKKTQSQQKKKIIQREPLFKWFLIFLLIIVLGFTAGAAGSVVADKYIMPYLSTIPALSRYNFFQSDKPVIVQKNEKITVTEESGVIAAVKKISPAVVSIVSTRDARGFFGDVWQQKSGGTGFILTNDGLIATNKHVVADTGATYTVIANDGKNYPAKILARDPSNDFAVIKVEAENLAVATLGNSQDLQVGQNVIAIGNTLGEYQNTVTTGVVSAIGRSISAGDGLMQSENLEDVIQTDAAINPGNSGGPLVNIAGQVIGINTAIDRGGQLVGFAIPINNVQTAIDSIIREGKIIRPYIGIRFIPITKDFAALNKLASGNGVLIYSGDPNLLAILPDSPAQKSGLKEMDIITKINNQDIDEGHSLNSLLSKYKPGDEVLLKVLRQNETLEKKVVLGKMDDL
ncbi:MAG: trypsin-like peptidase domain-containing protein [bacterium]|nr:trypsin-like peptidase domain-containing protein [bacterium]